MIVFFWHFVWMDLKQSIIVGHIRRHPTHLPFLVSSLGVIAALLFSTLMVLFKLNENGILFIVIAGLAAAFITIPAGYVHYRRERYIEVQNERLKKLASVDSLTGALNRRAFYSAVRIEQARMNRSGSMSALIVFDMDRFKQINDGLGHAVGDQVLKRVANSARRELRKPSDHMARWGGEEFAIFLGDVSHDQALGVADRLRLAICELTFEGEAADLIVSASFGVSLISSNGSIDEAIREADRALYEAKNTGRNRVVGFDAHNRILAA